MKKKPAAVQRIAELIRQECLQREYGERIGSEDDLLANYGTSRLTLRHASAVVVAEQLLKTRRGANGGYFASRPKSDIVAHIAAIYLQTVDTSLKHLLDAQASIRVGIVGYACTSKDNKARVVLREFIEQYKEVDHINMTFDEFMITQREFARILYQLSGNPVFSLFSETLIDLTANLYPIESIFRNKSARYEEYANSVIKLGEAVYNREKHLGPELAKKMTNKLEFWAKKEDLLS